MAVTGSYALVPIPFGVGIAFSCQQCGRPLTIRLEEIRGPFTCRQCSARIDIPVIRCYDQACGGTYETCRGSILKLAGDDLERERAAAWAGEPRPTGRPTDADHDDWRDVESSILSYRCSRCATKYNNATANRLHFSERGATACERTICGRCLRAPTREELKAGA
jgi:DNA-directed RNA polymerase subunit RPC12/RpoP